MRRNTRAHTVVFRNPEDRSDVVRVEAGGTYDDSADWVGACADAEGGQEEVTDLSALTVPELKNLAVERGVEVESGAKKDDLLSALQ